MTSNSNSGNESFEFSVLWFFSGATGALISTIILILIFVFLSDYCQRFYVIPLAMLLLSFAWIGILVYFQCSGEKRWIFLTVSFGWESIFLVLSFSFCSVITHMDMQKGIIFAVITTATLFVSGGVYKRILDGIKMSEMKEITTKEFMNVILVVNMIVVIICGIIIAIMFTWKPSVTLPEAIIDVPFESKFESISLKPELGRYCYFPEKNYPRFEWYPYKPKDLDFYYPGVLDGKLESIENLNKTKFTVTLKCPTFTVDIPSFEISPEEIGIGCENRNFARFKTLEKDQEYNMYFWGLFGVGLTMILLADSISKMIFEMTKGKHSCTEENNYENYGVINA